MQEKLQNIFRKIFANNALLITPDTSAKDIEQWDSLMHIELIAAIEEEFNINFSFNEVLQFNNVGDMMKLIQKKLNQ